MKHLALFETEADFETAKDSLELPYIAMTEDNKGIHFDFEKPVPEEALCFTALVDNSSVGLNLQVSKTMFMKLNGGEWQTWDCSTVNLNNGDKLYVKSSDSNPMTIKEYYASRFTMTGKIAASGNIMSLLNYTDTMTEYGFIELFNRCTSLITAHGLKLPATTLADKCYRYMFSLCTSLTTAPELPATTLADYCYAQMFAGCTSLTTAPELPVTTLANGCYGNMFSRCTSLTTAPELPATTLANNCYDTMFSNCTSLTTAPELPATTLAKNCYTRMFVNCTSLTTAPELPITTLADYCYQSMFQGCTSLTTAPELPATTLVQSCYSSMFKGCTSLTTAPELPATTLGNSCYGSMFNGCSNLNFVKALFIDWRQYALSNWLDGVSPTGTFVKSKDATWSESEVIPSGWTVETV